MYNSRIKPLAACLLAGTLAVGCQTNPTQTDTGGGSSDATRTKTEGAVAGAAIGALLGYAIGGDSKGALIGAALGGGTGFFVGNEIAKRKQQYASDEDFLDAEIASAKEYNATTVAYNNKLRGEIAQLDRDTKLLESRYRAGLASRDELAREQESVQQELASANQLYDDLKKEYEIKTAILQEEQQQDGGSPQVKALEREIAQLKKNMDELQSQSVQLAQIDERLTL
jgi:hypothetical protein